MPPRTVPFQPDVLMMLMQVMENKEAALALGLALDQLKLYEAIATRQNKRIWDAQGRAVKAMERLCQVQDRRKTNLARARFYQSASADRDRWFSISNAEGHLYLICWESVRKLVDTVKDTGGGLQTPMRIWKIHRDTFRHYKDARDHMEHWNARLPGKKENKWEKSDFEGFRRFVGNMGRVRVNGRFTFHNDAGREASVDIGPDSAKLLEQICRELREGLTTEVKTLFERKETIADFKPRSTGTRNTDRVVTSSEDLKQFSQIIHIRTGETSAPDRERDEAFAKRGEQSSTPEERKDQ